MMASPLVLATLPDQLRLTRLVDIRVNKRRLVYLLLLNYHGLILGANLTFSGVRFLLGAAW
jgi:hypothetical protein